MTDRSRRSRLMTVLIAVLLVTSLGGPAFATPAAADDEPGCLYEQIGIPWFSCQPDEVVEVSQDETMIHTTASAEAQAMDQHYTTLDNQLEDTSTIASLEARHAIAQSWEDGESEAQAYQNALEAIRDYYAVQQENHLAQKEKSLAQLTNAADAAYSDDEVDDQFLSVDSSASISTDYTEAHITNQSVTDEAEFVNGEQYNYTVPIVEFYINGASWNGNDRVEWRMAVFNESVWTYDEDEYDLTATQDTEHWHDQDQTHHSSTTYTDFRVQTMNVGDIEDGGLPSETVYDNRDWLERWYEIEHQSQQAVSNYDQDFVGALYDELDAGNIEPEEVRGAEGMARYLSGDDEVTGQRFQMALMQMSGMSNPDLVGTSSMTVEYDGYTDITYNGTADGYRVAELSDPVEGEYHGLLFASEVPEGGFETGQAYAVGDVNTSETDTQPINGSAQMYDVTTGETTHFYEGEFTITEMYDGDGNEVEAVEWDQPQYDTYDASEFVEYLADVQELREVIMAMEEDDETEASIGLPGSLDDFFDDLANLEPHAVGIVLIAFALLAAIAASNREQ